MRKLKLFLSLLMVMLLSVGNVWATDVSFKFSTMGSTGWTSGYAQHSTTCTDGTITFVSASKQTGTITDYPVTKGNPVTFVLSDNTKSLSSVSFTCRQWSSRAQTITLHYSTNSGSTYTSTEITSTNFSISSSSLPTGTNAVKITFSSTSNQVGIQSMSYTLAAQQQQTIPVASVTLDESAITLNEDETQELNATVLPANASNKNVTWTSDDEDVATVVDGVVTAVGKGDAIITCTSVADNSKSATCDVHVNSPYEKSKLIFTAACGGSGTANDGAEWSVTSDGTESVYDGTSGIHYGTNNANVTYVQLATSDITGEVAKVVVNARDAQATATISVTVGGTEFTCASATATNTSADYVFTGTGSGEIVVRVDRGSSKSKAIYVKSVVVSYTPDQKQPADLAYNEVDQKKLTKLDEAFTAPTLTNPNGLSVSYESNNTAVAEVAANGAVTIKAVGFAEITASFAGNDDYKAGSAKYTIGVVEHEGTLTDPYSVADAKAVIDALGGKENVYATGIVSTANLNQDNIDQYHNASYWISDDGTTANQLEAFRGRYLEDEDITSVTDILVEDEVVIYGTLTKHDDIYEFAAGNYLISLNRNKAEAGLNYAIKAIEKEINAAAFTNDLSNPNSLTVTYTSSDENLATVDENGEVTVGNEDGVVTITASTTGDATHLAGTATYTLTIVNPSLTKVTFDATLASDIAEDNDEGVTKSGINIKTSHTDGVNDQSNLISYYQCFKNANLTVTSTVGNIKKIEFVTTGGSYTSDGFAGVSNDKWTGNASEVVLTASGHQVRMSKIIVSYIPDNRSAAGLAWSTDAIELTVGDEFTAPTLQNPNSIDAAEITIESDNENLAEVNAGVVSLVADATGTATITATFNGNDDYKPAIVSYTITVNEAGLDNITFDATVDIAGTNELSITKGGFTLEFTNGAMGNGENYRLYKNQTMTLSSTDYKIKKIEFTCTTDKPIDGFADDPALDKDNNQWTGDANSVSLTASNEQVRMTLLKVYYVEDTRAASGLAWSTDEIEITLGDEFTAATLQNPNGIDASAITIESDNEYLAEVNAGVVSLVDNATGTAHITATFAGNDDYKPATISYTIIVNDPTPEIITNPTTYLNFGSVEQGATINAKNLQVTLQNVAAATVAITGEGAAAFSADPMALSASGTIIVSASSANVGTFAATLTISDNAGQATAKEISLSLTVTEPVAEDDVTGTWTLVTDASTLAAGKKIIIAQYINADGTINTMAEQRSNNRGAIESAVAGASLTPEEGTKVFTLVAVSEGIWAFQGTDNKYLCAASSGSNYLKSQETNDAEGQWSISIDTDAKATITAQGENTRKLMRYNPNNGNPIFSCYATNSTTGTLVALYMLEEDTPEPPVVNYTEVRNGLTEGWYYTMCLDKAVTAVKAGSIWRVLSKAANNKDIILEEVTGTLDAGRPYIFRAAASTLEVAYTGDAVLAPVTEGNNGLVGAFEQASIAQVATNYIIYNNALYYVNSDNVYVGANRAYLDMTGVPAYSNEPQQGNAPRRRVVMTVHGEQVATGIDAINAAEAPVKVMINGQIFILRGEKMYDATGRLVK